RLALHDGDAIVIDVQVPKPAGPGDQRFLKEVGETVSVTTKNYDPQSGRGEIDKLSFGYADGRVTASDTTLNIRNASSLGCSGSFRVAEAGLLRGRITCRWGHAYPTYDATINLGL